MSFHDVNRLVASTPRLTRRKTLTHAGGLAAMTTILGHSRAEIAAAQEGGPAVTSTALGDVTEERVALAVERAPELARELLDRSGVPGMAVAIVQEDAVRFLGGYGVREIGTTDAIDTETVFQLASVSKPIASTAVATVVGDGTLSWDSRMADIDPGFALREAWPTQEVTLAGLFAHRSGLPAHAGDALEGLGFPRDEIIYRLRYLEPGYSFRNGYAYTNFGLTAAAVAAANAAGMSWEDLSADRLYEPLGMTRTSSRFADYMAYSDRAIPHIREKGQWIVSPVQRDPDAQSPAGGVSSTARDLAQWVQMVLGHGVYNGVEVIPRDAMAPIFVPQVVSRVPENPGTDRATFYGLGWIVSYTDFGAVRWSHTGAFGTGASTAVYLLPAAGFGVLALTNGMPVGADAAFCFSMMDLAERGEISRDWLDTLGSAFESSTEAPYGTGTDWNSPPEDASDARPVDAYVGTYRNNFYGDVEVVHSDEGLALRIGPLPLEFPLRHYNHDTFSWQLPGEPIPSGLTFTVGPDGAALAFRDEYLGSDGSGILSRVMDEAV